MSMMSSCYDLVQHEIHVMSEFKPRRLPAYRMPESLKDEVQRQIDEMLAMGIIKPSKSEMASPIVCVLKGKDGKDGVRLTFLTEAAPKSAKLMQWALALQEYDVTFCYKKGKQNVAADCLSRMGLSDDNVGLPVATRITSTE